MGVATLVEVQNHLKTVVSGTIVQKTLEYAFEISTNNMRSDNRWLSLWNEHFVES